MAKAASRIRSVLTYFHEHPLVTKSIQIVLLVVTVAFCAWAVQSQWSKARPLLENASPAYLALSFAVVAVYFMLRALGAEVGLATLPFLGGVSAVGAIVAVVAVFGPSGIGAREASMYGLLLALTTSGPALGVTIVNRLAITLVEVLLFGAGIVGWRLMRPKRA